MGRGCRRREAAPRQGVILQTPAWWMASPWQVKRYIDEVFMQPGICGGDGRTRTAPDINYGTGGLLTGRYMISSTWNAPRAAFVAEGDFLRARASTASFCPCTRPSSLLA